MSVQLLTEIIVHHVEIVQSLLDFLLLLILVNVIQVTKWLIINMLVLVMIMMQDCSLSNINVIKIKVIGILLEHYMIAMLM